jgi:predicted aminopeptidase
MQCLHGSVLENMPIIHTFTAFLADYFPCVSRVATCTYIYYYLGMVSKHVKLLRQSRESPPQREVAQ